MNILITKEDATKMLSSSNTLERRIAKAIIDGDDVVRIELSAEKTSAIHMDIPHNADHCSLSMWDKHINKYRDIDVEGAVVGSEYPNCYGMVWMLSEGTYRVYCEYNGVVKKYAAITVWPSGAYSVVYERKQ